MRIRGGIERVSCIRGLGQHAHVVSVLSYPAGLWGNFRELVD
jgi:hypothetical protein